MSVTEEVARLVLETIGGDGLDALKKKLAETTDEMGETAAAFGRGEIKIDEYDAHVKGLTATHKQLSAAINELEKASGKARNKMAGLGQAGLQTGRVIQDFAQGGIGGVLNNIEGFTQALGGGPGLAGALTGLGVAFFILKPIVTEFISSFRGEPVKAFTGTLDTLQDKLKALTDKPHKVKFDLEQIEQVKQQIKDIEKGLQTLEALKTGRTIEEKAAGDEFSKKFTASGQAGKDAIDAVERQLKEAYEARDPDVRKARRAVGDRQAAIARAEKRQQEAEARRDGPHATDGQFQAAVQDAESAAKETAALKDLRFMRPLVEAVQIARDNAHKLAKGELGKSMDAVMMGNSPIARDVMAERFRAVGQDHFAAMVENAAPETPAQVAAREHAIEKGKERDKANAKKLKDIKERPGLNLQNVVKDAKATHADSGNLIDYLTKQDRDLTKDKKKIDLESTHKQIGAMNDAENASIKSSGIDKVAENLIAQGHARGWSDAKVRAFVEREVKKYLHRENGTDKFGRPVRANAGMGKEETEQLATRITAKAGASYDKDLLTLSGKGLNQQQAAQRIAIQTQAVVASMANKLRQIEVNNGRLMAENRRIADFLQQPGPTNLPGGQ